MIFQRDNVTASWPQLWIGRLLCLALFLRLLAAFAVQYYTETNNRQFLIEGDANGYWELAGNVIAGKDYAIHTPPRYVLRTPGFPLFLASVRLLGDHILLARIFLAVVGTACCWLTYRLGKKISDSKTAFWATVYVAMSPLHIGNSVLILSETLFAAAMLASLNGLAMVLQHSKHRIRHSVLTGIAIGIAVLIRPGFLPWLAPATLAAMFLSQTDLQSPHRKLVAAAMVGGCLITLQPWALRNQSVTGHYVLTSLWSGPSMYDGLNPQADGSSNMTFFDQENVMDKMSEYEMNVHYRQRALEYALQNPTRSAELAIAKVGRFLSPYPNLLTERKGQESYFGVKVAFCAIWGLLFVPFMVAFFRQRSDLQLLLLTLGPAILAILIHLVFVGSIRYRLPVEFPLAIFAARAFTVNAKSAEFTGENSLAIN